MIRRVTLAAALLFGLAACSGVRETQPGRTATEQLLFSVAAERAADQLALEIPAGKKVFVDLSYIEGTDSKYLAGTIRDRILRRGAAIVDVKEQAELVVEPRVGAISIDRNWTTLGTREFDLPVPLAGDLSVPEIAFYKRDTQQGVIKIAATTYDRESGQLVQSLDPVYGFAHRTKWGLLLVVSWETNDLMPDGPKQDWVGH